MSDFIDFITWDIDHNKFIAYVSDSLVVYLGIPVLVITYYRFKHPKVHPIILYYFITDMIVQITLWENIYQKQIDF